ncbi:unnamed protein product (macronuclear) [Paramecium tetraurelia]|uniref:Uncharacterized protein n=1 Tax=Paramecium tetraurelia TaxID=5888 RepID=A0CRF0_PARTE|nr:uncharacterized protein GSPATT00009682001 [Paramecium tetraurelia]CAK73367.1 unnamed protein product [Paramecium tetraurelia]|eukprot:XP_001440764.1 hypothetical protein (macronuclear) [Paramecium tetraurelia strain d4-2]
MNSNETLVEQEKQILENTENIDTTNTEQLLDFTTMFKNQQATKPKLLNRQQQQQTQSTDELTHKQLQNTVPRNLTITQELMSQRRCLDVRRWYSLSRPQYKKSCGISSVVTCWNYLFSTLGVGTLNPLSQEEVIVSLGPEVGPHFNEVEFGSFSGNMSLISWFKNLCRLQKVQGRAYFLWKNEGDFSTPGVDRDVALSKLTSGLKSDKISYIYHAYNHYFCPIGFECTPNKQVEAFADEIDQNDCQYWIIIAEPAKPYPMFTVRKWVDIAQDLELKYPQYMKIRKMNEGIKRYKNEKGVSQHCIMAFERIDPKPKKMIEKKEKPITNEALQTIKKNNLVDQQVEQISANNTIPQSLVSDDNLKQNEQQ